MVLQKPLLPLRDFSTKKYKNRIFKNNNLPIGEIYDSHTFALVDKNFNKVSKGDKGHLIIKGKQITNGYVNDIEKTKESFKIFLGTNQMNFGI